MLTLALALAAVERGNARELLRLAAYSESQFVYYANQVPVIFQFVYCDNEENKRKGRVGKSSGFRQGVRNLNFVPAAQHPSTPGSRDGRKVRVYYDLGRQRWRSFRKGNLRTISAFWSVAEQRFVDTPEEAGIVRGKEYEAAPSSPAEINPDREARTAKRAAARKEREKQARSLRLNDNSARAARLQARKTRTK
jgi:hypothetical protein